jgi:hypothetical protein
VNINDVLDGHVALEVECVDRVYLNAYVPNLQVSGQLVRFMTDHLGLPVPSPAILEKIGNRFRRAVDAFARDNDIPVLHLKKPDRTRWDDRKLDHVRPYLEAAEADGRFGVVAIVVAQEFQWVFSAVNRSPKPGVVSFDFPKTERRVGTYYLARIHRSTGPFEELTITEKCLPARENGGCETGQNPNRKASFRCDHRTALTPLG